MNKVSIEESKYLPTKCPVCGVDLEWVGVDLKCNNNNCPNIKMSDLQQWCESIGETDGLQWTLMKQYLDAYGVSDIASLYSKAEQIWTDLNARKLSLTEIKIREFFEKLYILDVDVEKALVGLNIPRLGEKTAKLLSKEPELIYDYLVYLYDVYIRKFENNNLGRIQAKLLDVVKDATTQSILENGHRFINLLYLYKDMATNLSRLKYKELSEKGEISYVAVTGALNTMKRKDFEAYIEKFGYVLSSNLKKCKYLITNTPDSGSSKNKQAQEYGIPLITEEDFLNSLN